jgi:hypothetical protein
VVPTLEHNLALITTLLACDHPSCRDDSSGAGELFFFTFALFGTFALQVGWSAQNVLKLGALSRLDTQDSTLLSTKTNRQDHAIHLLSNCKKVVRADQAHQLSIFQRCFTASSRHVCSH